MAIIASSSSLKLSNPFPSSLKFSPPNSSSRSLLLSLTRKATESENNESSSSETTETPAESTDTTSTSTEDQDSFENKLAQVRLRYKSGTGKKAELRKGKKSKGTNGGSGGGGNVFLPPVPLKEPVSGGVKVEMGFSRYTERLNGRLAGLGLAALLLVELATGKSVLNYHSPSIVFIQIYFVAAVSAMYVKFEKEKVSIWPR
ncbi:hypothetical protein C5167_046663 [Papaver somniferum]|uniref:Uncharacterized protein n=1 Tax=Papaver somniferum TaxID=3469 RepID=A0A4Y7LF70_PAPSO|nr:uncharacterized protein LOC113322921 [Papaver somniferum]RZC83876.1 hypothetical protein C5167_046663 [Papaver somniferum]